VALLVCPACERPISPDRYNTGLFVSCPQCGAALLADAFPALARTRTTGGADGTAIDGEATCFFHSTRRADTTCGHCGRFICTLCEIELNGQRLCPECLETGRRKGRIKNLDRERTLYDSIALRLSIYPIITLWLTVVTAPISLYIALRHWRSPLSVTRRSRIRYVLAIVSSGLQVCAWAAFILFLFYRR
jgi:hypothetical protein